MPGLELLRHLPDLFFREMTDREPKTRELLLAQAREEISLVLHRVGRALEQEFAIALLDLRIMTGNDFIASGIDLLEEEAELDPLVAENVGTGRAPLLEFAEDVRDDALLVFGLERDDLKRNFRLVANGARVFEIVFPRTIAEKGELLFEPDLEIECRHLSALHLRQMQGHRAIHSAGHRYDHPGVLRGAADFE